MPPDCHVLYDLNNFCKGSPKEHFYQIILEFDKQIRRRRFLKFGHFAPFLIPQLPKFSMKFKSLNNFQRGPPKEHSCDVLWKLFLWFRRRWCLKLKVNDGRTDDGQRVIRIDHLEPSAQVILKAIYMNIYVSLIGEMMMSNVSFAQKVFGSKKIDFIWQKTRQISSNKNKFIE